VGYINSHNTLQHRTSPAMSRLALANTLTVALFAAALALPSAVLAQTPSPPRPKPKDLEKIDDVPPPPNVLIEPRSDTKAVEPQVLVRTEDGKRIEEFRVKGKLYKMRITPENGAPYWLIDSKGDGSFVRADTGLTPNNSVPMWVLLEW